MAEFLLNPPKFIPSSSAKSEEPKSSERIEKHYPSYSEVTGVSPKARILCQIIAESPPSIVESVLSATGITPNLELIQEVLKLSYGYPDSAVKFFRWSGFTVKPDRWAWSLMTELLGKNEMFEQMWDAIRTMKQEGFLSTSIFCSAFESYCTAGRIKEAVMTYEVMEKYGIEPDVVAVNSMLSAMFHDKRTKKALEFFEMVKSKVAPDAATFAILFEGLEKAENVKKSMNVFGEMVLRIGWDPKNAPAYDAFLNTLVRGSQVEEAFKFFQVMKSKNCLPSLRFFSNALDVLVEQNNVSCALELWSLMVDSGFIPNLTMYNAMIGLLCNNNDIGFAFRLLDEMVFYGAFPDSLTYNMVFQCLVKKKTAWEVGSFFIEMVKNECPPTHSNCTEAIKMLFAEGDPEIALEIWNFVSENQVGPIDESANAFLVGLCRMGRFLDMKRFAIEMLDKKIKLYGSTIERLKFFSYQDSIALDVYNSLQRRLRGVQNS